MPIVKSDGSIRLCGDYKVTINQDMLIHQYPLPKVNHLIASLDGGVYFTKIDLKESYTQVLLSEESKKYFTINTHKGLYQPTYLQYGVASAPGFFQNEDYIRTNT